MAVIAFEPCRRPEASVPSTEVTLRLHVVRLSDGAELPVVSETIVTDQLYQRGLTVVALRVLRAVQRRGLSLRAVAVAAGDQQRGRVAVQREAGLQVAACIATAIKGTRRSAAGIARLSDRGSSVLIATTPPRAEPP